MTTELAGTTPYHLLCFNASGVERRMNGRLDSDEVVARLESDPVTDVILLSHGWFGDVPAARDQYHRWIGTMQACTVDREAVHRARPDFTPLIVGLHWPSLAWGDEQVGQPTEPDPVAALAQNYSAALPDTPTARDAVRTIIEAGLADIAPPVLPHPVREAYTVLHNEAGFADAGAGAAPGDDAERFDPDATYQAARIEDDIVAFGSAGGLGGALLAPLRAMTFWRMKRRACRFGESGAATLMRRLQCAIPPDRDVRFHLMGHSFGCIVASACIAGSSDMAGVRVDSLTLVQGAMSLWSFSSTIPARRGRAGYFHRVLDDHLVTGPTVVTTSAHDRAVGSFYPLGAGVAGQTDFAPGRLPLYGGLGTFGARGPLPAVVDLAADPADAPYDLRQGVVHNVDCTGVIAQGDGPAGAHSDICHPEIAHLVWTAISHDQKAEPSDKS